LGGIAENNLFIASRIYGWSWLLHPGVLVIALITLVGVFYPYIGKLLKPRSESATLKVSEKPTVTTVPLPLIARVGQSLFALFILLVMAYVVYEAKWGFGSWEPRAALFPWAIGVPTFLLALYVFIKDSLQSSRKAKVEEYRFEDEPGVDPILARQRTVAITCWIVGFFLAIWIIGFIPASAIATLLYLKFGAGERWPVTLAVSAACGLFFWGMFDYALQMPFPAGAVFDWLPVKVADLQWSILSKLG
jgi:MFS family permease